MVHSVLYARLEVTVVNVLKLVQCCMEKLIYRHYSMVIGLHLDCVYW